MSFISCAENMSIFVFVNLGQSEDEAPKLHANLKFLEGEKAKKNQKGHFKPLLVFKCSR